MTVLLALAVLAPVQVIEIQDSTVDRVAIQAVLPLPAMDPLVRASADVLAHVVTSDNDFYSGQEMRDLCVPGGQPKCYAMADHMAIQLSVLPADTGAGMRMLAAMVSSARMEVPVMNQYLLTEPYRHKSVWSLALDSEDRAWDRLRASDIEDLYKRVFRPDNITVAAGGALRPGVAQAAWDDASKNWRRQVARPLRQAVPFKEYPQPYPSHVLELHGPEIMPSDPGLASKILALVALGGGKSSSLFRVVRGDLALSYRQEAALWPTKDGLVPRVLVQIRPRAVEQEAVELNDIRVALLADIAAWDSSVLERAQGFAGAMSTNGMELGPLYFRPSAPLGPSIEDRTLLVAYWQMKTGAPWNGLAMADAFRSVDLGTLKAEAAGLVEVAIPVLHPREG